MRDESKRLLNTVLEKVNTKADEMAAAEEENRATAAAKENAATTTTTTGGNTQGDQGWTIVQSISKKITSVSSQAPAAEPPASSTSPKHSTTSGSGSMKLGVSKPAFTASAAAPATQQTISKPAGDSGWDIDDDDGFGDDDNWGDSDSLIFDAADSQKQPTSVPVQKIPVAPKPATTSTASVPAKGMTLGMQHHTAAPAPKKEEKKPTVTKLSGAWDWDDDSGDGW